jgi:hypothetical protein
MQEKELPYERRGTTVDFIGSSAMFFLCSFGVKA